MAERAGSMDEWHRVKQGLIDQHRWSEVIYN
jgi:hypothetical protein